MVIVLLVVRIYAIAQVKQFHQMNGYNEKNLRSRRGFFSEYPPPEHRIDRIQYPIASIDNC
jgi:hypothetical protein